MKRKTRRILFYSSIGAFIILSMVVVLFALGYDYDFVQGKLLKTGSFDIKTNVSAEVYINDALAGKTSFLTDYFSKGRLLPRAYSIRVQNDKYQLWQKLIKIDAGFLTSFPKVILLPKSFQEEVVASSSIKTITIARFDSKQGIAFLGNKQKIESIDLKTGKIKPAKLPTEFTVVQNNPAKLTDLVRDDIVGLISPDESKAVAFYNNEIWVRWFKDSNYQPFKKAGDHVLVTRFLETITDIQWYKDSEHLLVNVSSPDKNGILKLIEIDDRDGINVFDITTVFGPFYYDKDRDLIYKFEGSKLIRINLE